MCGKNFQIDGIHILRKFINLGIFTHVPPHSKIALKFLSLHPKQKEVTHSPRQHFFKNQFPSTTERGKGNYDLLYQKSVRKNEDDLGHQVISTLHDL